MNKTIKIFIIILLIGIIIAGCMWGVAALIHNKEISNISDDNKVHMEEYDLDKIYSSKITSEFKDIRDLPKDYDSDYNRGEAQKDKCLVLGAMVHNEHALIIFMESYSKKEAAFIRIVQRNAQNEVDIIDLFYDDKADVIYCVTDKTRECNIDENQKKIKLEKFEHMDEHLSYNGHEYWVLYNGEHPGDDMTIKEKIKDRSLYTVFQMN